MFLTSAPPPGWVGDFSCPCMVKLGSQIVVFYVCREHIPGIMNLLNSLGRMWVSPHRCPIVLGRLVLLLHGFVAKHVCLVLWLSKATFLSNH